MLSKVMLQFVEFKMKSVLLSFLFLATFCFYYFSIIAYPALNDMRASNVRFSSVGLFHVIVYVLIPSFFLKPDFQRISSFFAWVIYLLVYTPMIVALSFDFRVELEQRWLYQCVFMVGMLCILTSSYLPFSSNFFLPGIQLSRKHGLLLFCFCTVGALSIIQYQLGGHLRFINPIVHFNYAHRYASRDLLSAHPLASYLSSILAYAVVPALVGFAFMQKKWIYLVVATMIATYLYLIASNKAFLFLVPLCMLVGFLRHAHMKRQLAYLLGSLTFSICLFTMLILIFKPVPPIQDGFWTLIYLFLYRTVAISTETVVPYITFFKHHTHTFFAHAHGFDLLYTNPYPQGMGVAVGEFTGAHYNMSANFWLTDGIGGFGAVGVVLVSVLVTALFYLTDRLTHQIPATFAFPACSGILVGLSNSSLFSTMLSGGWLFVACILVALRK
jgi:hypothetical protein